MREAVIVAAVRTPVGRCRGALAPVPAQTLGALVVKEAVNRAGIDAAKIDEIIFANLMNTDVNNMARMVGLAAGMPVSVPGITVDRQCGSSLNALAYASILIKAGHGDIIVAGGVESDSRRPYLLERPTMAYQMTPPQWTGMKLAPEEYGNTPMGITAENVAKLYGLTRQECDEFALGSHRKAAKAWDSGYFDAQVVPVDVPLGKGKTARFAKDESLRPDTSLEALAALPPAFARDGIVTAGNSSPMSDGAGALVVMEKTLAKEMGLPVLAKFSGYATAGVDPNIMGIGPVASTRKLFAQTGLSMKDIDLIELNEAFAAQTLGCVRELAIPEEKLNVNGGAIALGHPLAGTGAVLATKMVYELNRRGAEAGLVTFCCGGGQGISVLLTRE